MTNQNPKEPTRPLTNPQPEPEKKRPLPPLTREEEIDYFRRAAESDIALRELFAKSAVVGAPAAAFWG